jgi:hypothetical protein
LHFHDVGIETLRVHQDVLLSSRLTFIILLVTLLWWIFWIVHKPVILFLAEIAGRLDKDLLGSHVASTHRGRFLLHVGRGVSLPLILPGLCC